MAAADGSSSSAASTLDRFSDETSPEYRAAAGALGEAQSRLLLAVREVASFRRASAEYAALARRFQGVMRDVLDAHDVGSALGARCGSDVAAAHGALVEVVDGGVASYLDRFMAGLQHHIKPGYDAASLHQERMLEALAARQGHSEAADAPERFATRFLRAILRREGAKYDLRLARFAFASQRVRRRLCLPVVVAPHGLADHDLDVRALLGRERLVHPPRAQQAFQVVPHVVVAEEMVCCGSQRGCVCV